MILFFGIAKGVYSPGGKGIDAKPLCTEKKGVMQVALANDTGGPLKTTPIVFGGTRKEVLSSIVLQELSKLFTRLYRICYYVGIQYMRTIKRYRRNIRFFVRSSAVWRFFHSKIIRKRLGAYLMLNVQEVLDPYFSFASKFTRAIRRIKEKRKRSLWLATKECAGCVKRGALHVLRGIVGLSHYVAPVLGILFLVMTIQYFSGLTFGLEVEYDGKTLGYITSETEFKQAEKMMQERIVADASAEPIYTIPTYKVTVVDQSELSRVDQICDELIKASNSVIVEASGLYIDEKFIGATYDRASIKKTLEGLLDACRTDEPTEKVNFVQSVKLVDGLYPQTTVKESGEIEQLITSEVEGQKTYTVKEGDSPWKIARTVGVSVSDLLLLNPGIDKSLLPGRDVLVSQAEPFLPIKVTKTIIYEDSLPYETVQTKSSSYTRGYTKITKKGVNGVQEITAEVTLVDGVETDRKILTSRVVQEPVAEQVTVGTKEIKVSTGGSTSSVGTGRFMWPVVGGGSVSCGFQGYVGHTGMDIVRYYGAEIVAADSGVVVIAKTNARGYGNHVMIDHGNGVQTLYAHLSKRYVSYGQKVSKGDTIGLMGRTGNVTGTHLHFEIRVNGRYMNPMRYF